MELKNSYKIVAKVIVVLVITGCVVGLLILVYNKKKTKTGTLTPDEKKKSLRSYSAI